MSSWSANETILLQSVQHSSLLFLLQSHIPLTKDKAASSSTSNLLSSLLNSLEFEPCRTKEKGASRPVRISSSQQKKFTKSSSALPWCKAALCHHEIIEVQAYRVEKTQKNENVIRGGRSSSSLCDCRHEPPLLLRAFIHSLDSCVSSLLGEGTGEMLPLSQSHILCVLASDLSRKHSSNFPIIVR